MQIPTPPLPRPCFSTPFLFAAPRKREKIDRGLVVLFLPRRALAGEGNIGGRGAYSRDF